MEDLRYPIGNFAMPREVKSEDLVVWIQDLRDTPENLRAAVDKLNDDQLNTPYRPEGWTVRQLVHHIPDSHMNSYIRMKLALTEDNPPAKGYEQDAWAGLPDVGEAPLEASLGLLEGLHKRWVLLMQSLDSEQLARTYNHSETGRVRLDTTISYYAWHGKHHVAHIVNLRKRMGW